MYFFLTAFVMGGYALIVTGIGLLINTSTDVLTNNPYLVGGSMLLLALLLEPFRVRLQTIVDNTFFRGERALAEKLETFSHSLTTALDLNSISTILREQIASTLTPSRIHIYTYNSLNDFFSALPRRRPPPDKRHPFYDDKPIRTLF